jgi:uncharacterized BrkB/YihY/UPF0761 family membrane protein
MTWFYWNSIALLVGAELNTELARERGEGQLPQKDSKANDAVRPAA